MAEEDLCKHIRGLNPAALGKALNMPEFGSRVLFHTSWCATCAAAMGPALDALTEREADKFNAEAAAPKWREAGA